MLRKINDIANSFFSLFTVVKVPKNHVSCPNCEGSGVIDAFIPCEYCDGDGHVPMHVASMYESEND